MNLTAALILILSFGVIGTGAQHEAAADPALTVQQAGSAINITDFQYDPAQLEAKVGQAITVTNNDSVPHTVTAEDGTFDVEVPPNGTATLTVSQPGSFPYMCTLHPNEHNPASINVS